MTKNQPKLCPGCGTQTIDATGLGRYCPSVECDRFDDMREDVSTPAFEELPELVTIPAQELEKLQDDLANALETIRKLQRENGRLQFTLEAESAGGCGSCPRSG